METEGTMPLGQETGQKAVDQMIETQFLHSFAGSH